LLDKSPLVSEVGLDGTSKVPFDLQEENLSTILDLAQSWRPILSVHSSGATSAVLDAISAWRTSGAILHWWLGNETETARAIALGCYFSVNASARSLAMARTLPRARVLTETDHPYGDRLQGRGARPGNLQIVEASLATEWGCSAEEARRQVWSNFASVVDELAIVGRLPRQVRHLIDSL
jgi:TatD DNase family protein